MSSTFLITEILNFDYNCNKDVIAQYEKAKTMIFMLNYII